MPSRTRATPVALLVALLGVAALGVVLWSRDASPAARTPAAVTTPGAPSIAFFGDSLTVGVGAGPQEGYAWVTAETLGWPIAVVDGVSGSGYLAPGEGDRPMPTRVDDVVAARPDVVVVEGGTNDVFRGYPPEEVGAAAADLIADLEQALPDAVVVVLGPFPGGYEAVDDDDPVRDAVRAAAQEAGVPFVDPRVMLADTFADPTAWDRYISDDGLHPSAAGYRVLGEALAEELRTIVG